jgi:hypothetical protein
MLRTRVFILLTLPLVLAQALAGTGESLKFQSRFLPAEFAPDQPVFALLAVDSVGKGKLGENPLLPPAVAAATFEVQRKGQEVEYWQAGAARR